jgi:hypothetical protein
MTIEVKLVPELEARLLAEAQTRGVPIEKMTEILLTEALAPKIPDGPTLSPEDFATMLEQMSEGADSLPALPTESFTRESFYEGRW